MNKIKFFLLGLLFFAASGSAWAQIDASFEVTKHVSCRSGGDAEISVTIESVSILPYGITIKRQSGAGQQTYAELYSQRDFPITITFSSANGNLSGTGATNGLIFGVYTITVIDSVGNSLSDDLTLFQPSEFLNEVLISNTAACGGNDGEVILTATGGNGTSTDRYEYNIDGGAFQTDSIFSNLAPGTYNFSVRDNKGCTDPTPLANVVILAPSYAGELNSTATQVCEGDNNFTITVSDFDTDIVRWESSTNNFVSFTNLGNAGQATLDIEDLTETTQYRVVVESEGCALAFSDEPIQIDVFPFPTVFDITPATDGCADPGLAIGLSDSENGMSYQLLLDGADVGGVVNGTGDAISFGTQTTAGTYTIEAFNASLTSCIIAMNGEVVINTNPTAEITGTANICEGQSTDLTFTLTGTGPFNVEYTDGADTILLEDINDTHILSVSPATTTTYDLVSVFDNNNPSCEGTLSGQAVITVNPIPVAVLSGDTTICEDSPADLIVNITGNGPFDIVYTDGTDEFNASGESPITISVGPTANTSYSLVSVTDDNNPVCTGTVSGSADVIVQPKPTAEILGDSTICEGGQVTLTFNLTGTGPFDVVYTDGDSEFTLNDIDDDHAEIITPLASADYTLVSVNDSNTPACSGTVSGTANVVVIELVEASISGNTTICEGNDATITFNFTPSSGTYDAVLNDGTSDTTLTDISNGFTLDVSPESTTTYSLVSVVDNTPQACVGTVDPANVTITVNSLPTASISGTTTICPEEFTPLTFTLTGVGPFEVVYTDGTDNFTRSNFDNGDTVMVSPLSLTTYTLVSVTDNNSPVCSGSVSGSAEISIGVAPTGEITGDTEVCAGSPATLTFTLNGTGPFDIEVTDGTTNFTLTGISSGETEEVNPTVTSTYRFVSIQDAVCKSTAETDTHQVNVNPIPVAVAGTTDTDGNICVNQSAQLTASGGTSYTWSTSVGLNDSTLQNPTFTSSTAGTFTFTVTVTDNGCSSTDDVTIIVNPIGVDADITSAPTEICSGSPIVLTRADDGQTMQWTASPGGGSFSVNNSTSPNTEYTPSAADIANGSVTITLTPSTNCGGAADAVTIDINPLPSGTISTSDVTLCEGGNVNVTFDLTGTAPFDIEYTLAIGAGAPSTLNQNGVGANPTQFLGPLSATAVLTLTSVKDANGCTVTPNDVFTATVNEIPVIDAGSNLDACASGDFTITGATSDIPTASFLWTHNGAGSISGANTLSPVYTPSEDGEVVRFKLSVTNTPCSAVTDSVDITFIQQTSISIDGADTQELCAGTVSFDLTTTFSGPTAGVTWSTSGDGGFDDVNAENPTYTFGTDDVTNETVTLTVLTDDPGVCEPAQDQIILNLVPGTIAASVDLGADTLSSCAGEEVTFTATITNGGSNPTISWLLNGSEVQSGGLSFASSSLVAGDTVSVNVNITDPSVTACLSTPQPMSDEVTISINALPTATITSADANMCSGGNANITFNFTGTAPFNVRYNDGSANIDVVFNTAGINTITVSPSSTRTYSLVSASDANCSASSLSGTTKITVVTPTVAVVDPDFEICGTSTTISANSPGAGTGQWSVLSGSGTFALVNDFTNNGVTDISVGENKYIWTITQNGCSTSDTLTVTRINVTTSNAGGDQNICTDNTTLAANTVTVSEAGTWSVISGTGTFVNANDPLTSVSGLSQGTNTFRWTIVQNACSSFDDVIVNVDTDIAFFSLNSAGSATEFCQLIDLTLTGSVNGHTYTLLQDGDSITSLNGTGSALVFSATESGTYQISANNGTCSALASNTVSLTELNQTSAIIIGDDITTCVNPSGDAHFFIAITGNGGPYDLVYSENGVDQFETLSAGTDGLSIFPNPIVEGVFIYKVVSITEANACPVSVSTDSVVISITNTIVPSVSIVTNNTCEGSEIIFFANTALNGTAQTVTDSNFKWFIGGEEQIGEVNDTLRRTGLAESSVISVEWTITDSDLASCITTATVSADTTLTYPDIPTFTAIGPFCEGDDAVALDNPITGGIWSGTGIVVDGTSYSFNPTLGADVLTYTATKDGCTIEAELNVVVNPTPTITEITTALTICSGELPLDLTTIVAPDTGVWSGADVTGNSFNPATLGNFELIYTLTDGVTSCTSSDTVTIEVTDQAVAPTLLVDNEITYCLGETVAELSASGTDINWYQVIGAADNFLVNNANVDISALVGAEGTYTFKATNTTSCGTADTLVTVQIIDGAPNSPTVGSVTAVCLGRQFSSVTASGIDGATFNWYNASSTLVFTGATFDVNPFIDNDTEGSTSFFVTQTFGSCGEGAQTEVVFTVKPESDSECQFICSEFVVSVASNSTSCPGETDGTGTIIILSGGTGTYEYKFNSESDAAYRPFTGVGTEISGLGQGSYPIQVRNQGYPDCIVSKTINVSANSSTLVVTADKVDPTCSGNNGEIKFVASGGSGTYQYQIVDASSVTTTNTTGQFTGLSAGTFTYNIDDLNTDCSVHSGTITLNTTGAPSGYIDLSDSIVCVNSNIDVPFNFSGAAPFNIAYTVQVGSGSVLTKTKNGVGFNFTHNLVNITDSTRVILTSITDVNGCTSTPNDLFIAKVVNIVTIDAGDDAIICTNNYTLDGNQNTGDLVGTWSFVVNGTQDQSAITFINPNQFDSEVTGLPAGKNLLVWTISDALNTCSKQDTVSIEVVGEFTTFNLSATDGETDFCESTTLTLSGSETGKTYSFFRIFNTDADPELDTTIVNSLAGTGAALTASVTEEGEYFVMASQASCKARVNTSNVVLKPLLQTSASIATSSETICLSSGSTSLNIRFDLEGNGGPYDVYYSINGVSQTPLNSGPDSFIEFAANISSEGEFEYKLDSVTESKVCSASVNTTPLVIKVVSEIEPTVSVVSNSVCSGDEVVFTATSALNGVVQGVDSSYYKWYVDGIEQSAETDSIFAISGLSEGSEVVVEWGLTANKLLACASTAQAFDMLNVVYSTQTTLPTLLVSDNQTHCLGQSIPKLKASGNDIQWIHGVTSFDEDSIDINSIANAVGIYEFIVTNTTGCGVASDTVTVEILNGAPAAPSVPAVTAVCLGKDFATITASGVSGATFNWYDVGNNLVNTGATFDANLLINNDASGTTNFFVSQSLGTCGESSKTTVSFTIKSADASECQFECAKFNVAVGSNSVSCPGATDGSGLIFIISGGTGTYEYKFTSDNDDTYKSFEGFGTEILNLAQGSYSITIRNQGFPECTRTRVINVSASPSSLLVSTEKFDPSCSGDDGEIQFTVVGGSGNYLFELVNSSSDTIRNNTGDFGSLSAGTYTYYVDDLNTECTVSPGVITLSNGPNLTATVGVTSPTCDGINGAVNISAQGGSGNYTFKLVLNSDDTVTSTSGLFTGLAAGDYVYLVEDNENACSIGSTPVSLAGATGFTVSATAFENPSCFNEATGKARLTLVGAASGQYRIGNGTWTDFISGNFIDNLPGANAPYNILVRIEEDGCEQGVEVDIRNPEQISIAGGITPKTKANCNPDVLEGEVNVGQISGGVSPYKFFVDGIEINTLDPQGAAGVISNLSRNNDSLRVEDAVGCSRTFALNLEIPGAVKVIVAELDPANECVTENRSVIMSLDILRTTGSGPFTVIINEVASQTVVFDQVIASSSFPLQINNLTRGIEYKYTVRTGEANACSDDNVFTLTKGAAPITFSISSIPVACLDERGSIVLSNIKGEPDVDYTYILYRNPLSGREKLAEGVITSLQASGASVALTSIAQNDVSNLSYDVQLIQESENCNIVSEIKNVIVQGPTGSLDAEVLSQKQSLPDQATGAVTIRLVNLSGATPYTAQIVIAEAEFPGTIGLLDLPQGFVPFEQELGSFNFTITFDSLIAGTYLIYVKDNFGCFIAEPLEVVIDFDKSIFIPNLITPNDDGLNDKFFIRNMPDTGSKIVITNRWGNIVYRSDNYKKGEEWDGGEEPDGVYFYDVIIEGKRYSGWLEVWRAKVR